MTRFQFRLQKVLEWREKQLEIEEIRLKQQAAEVAAIESERGELESAAMQAETDLRASPVSGLDLAALAGFRRYVHNRGQQLAARRIEALKRVEAQQATMLEARRRCRLLERLKERRLAEWTVARDKELDELASESFLAMWVRRGASPEAGS